jgi:hypothetical protein
MVEARLGRATGTEQAGAAPRLDWKELGGLLALMLAVVLLWNTFLLYPLKILVVFFHELSHGLAAVVTGGSIEQIMVTREEGGLCVIAGGSRFLTLTAGYLGSLAWGGAILVLAARTKHDKWILDSLGGLVILVAIVYVRPILGFGFIYCLTSGAAMLAIAVYLSPAVSDYLLKVIGLTSCLYAILDIKSDILDRPESGSDAWHLAQYTRLPVWFWGILWIAVAALGAFGFLLLASRRSRSPAAGEAASLERT